MYYLLILLTILITFYAFIDGYVGKEETKVEGIVKMRRIMRMERRIKTFKV